jgi:hypothetical protein
MANCSGSRGDPTDLIAQVLCQELFNMKPRIHLEDYAVQAARTSNLLWAALVEELVENRVQNTSTPPLDDVVGIYVNEGAQDQYLCLQASEGKLEKVGPVQSFWPSTSTRFPNRQQSSGITTTIHGRFCQILGMMLYVKAWKAF